MTSWSRRQQALVAGLLVAVALLAAITIAVWPDGDEPVAANDDGSTPDVEPLETTTTATTATTEPATTTSPTVVDGTTTTEAPTTTETPTPAAARPAPTTTSAPSPTPPEPTTMPPPPYRSSIEAVNAEQLGASYTSGIGCAVPADLRAVNVTHWGYDGAVHDGQIVVHGDQASNVAAIFGDLYAAGFPIQRIDPIDAYGGQDQPSMRANNTSGYNCRTVAGTDRLSNHATGMAIDVNPLHNPYVKASSVDPPEGAPWADRSNRRPGMIYGGDAVVTAFEARGWQWGGYWNSGQDYQHFSPSGR